jgi:uncharacterized membrane protein
MQTNVTPHFDVVLSPHRSLKPAHFQKLLIGLIVLCTTAGIRFTLIGAWPVAAFLWLDLAALWLAFFINYRRARVREFIRLTESELIIERMDKNGGRESWVFEPYWVKLAFEETHEWENSLTVQLHSQKVAVGGFLSPPERKSLYKALQSALVRWKKTSH